MKKSTSKSMTKKGVCSTGSRTRKSSTKTKAKATPKRRTGTTAAKATPKRKTARKSTAKRGGLNSTISKAQQIYEGQKKAFATDFKKRVSSGRNPVSAAKEAGRDYREKYGATKSARWKNAVRSAKVWNKA